MNAITTTLPQTIALLLASLSIVAIIVLFVQFFFRRNSSSQALSEQLLPNIFFGWALLWMISAVLLWTYPFPSAQRLNPIRAMPPGITPTPSPELTSESAPAVNEAAVKLLVNNGCGGCHLMQGVSGMVGIVGPELNTIGAIAAERIADPAYSGTATTVEEYIRESILNPTVFITPNYPAGIMLPTFNDTLSSEDLETIVQYLAEYK